MDSPAELLTAEHFPGLHKKYDGKPILAELLAGRYKGVALRLPLVSEAKPLGPRMDIAAAIGTMIDETHDWAAAFAYFANMRLFDCKGAPRAGGVGTQTVHDTCAAALVTVRTAAACFDLRALAVEPCTLDNRDAALKALLASARRSGVTVPADNDALAQLEVLRKRLVATAALARTPRAGKVQWFDSSGAICSGTVIAKELLTTPKLYEDLGPLLFVFQHCTLKGNNEAVNEGLGGTISIHADGQRGLSVEKALAEARIHRNGPPLVHADAVLTGALNRYFEDTPWHFKHAEESRSLVAISGISLVLKRLKATQPLASFFQ